MARAKHDPANPNAARPEKQQEKQEKKEKKAKRGKAKGEPVSDRVYADATAAARVSSRAPANIT